VVTTKLFIFIKIGREEHVSSLLNDGSVYMNTVQRLRAADLESGRGDPTEGRSFVRNCPPGEFQVDFIKDKWFRYERFSYWETPKGELGNVYSLFTLAKHHTIGLSSFRMNSDCVKLGTHWLLIKAPGEFMKRLDAALCAAGLKFRQGLVNYYDDSTYSGRLSVFYKPNGFAYQQEFRYHVSNGNGKPLLLNIGSLRDIAEMHPISAIEHFAAYPVPRLLPHLS
jgi:hypothetical protein